MSNMCDLPEDVVTEVLVRVSPEPEVVKRLKCVSKSWQTLIDRPEFRATWFRLHHRECRGTRLILLSGDDQLYMSGRTDSPETMESGLTKVEQGTKDVKVETIGSCNGLVCLLLNSSKFLVLNPYTEQRVEFPACHINTGDPVVVFGFGYDSVSDDYKVVRIQGVHRREVKVYSLKSKCWKDLDDIEYYPGIIKSCVYANGALHCMMGNRFTDEFVILAMDLSTEKYHTVQLPVEIDVRARLYIDSLQVVDGFLSLVVRGKWECGRRYHHPVEVWTMNKYGVRDSWTKLSWKPPAKDLQIHSKSFRDLGWEARRIKAIMQYKNVLVFRSLGNLIWHDIENKVEDQIVSDPPCSKTWKRVLAFTPSLVHFGS